MYRQSIAPDGCEIVEASDGPDALAKALAYPPALVITASKLPLIDGYALCEILRRDHATAHVPVLVIADAPAAEVERARRIGAYAVLVKPITSERIRFETQRLIATARTMRGYGAAMRTKASAQQAQSAQMRARLSKSFARFTTTTPPATPPELVCPSCDRPLTYQESYVGGVSAKSPEQWDHYVCPSACGTFQYRQRTRRVRRSE